MRSRQWMRDKCQGKQVGYYEMLMMQGEGGLGPGGGGGSELAWLVAGVPGVGPEGARAGGGGETG